MSEPINLTDLALNREFNFVNSSNVYDVNYLRTSQAFSKYGLGALIRFLPDISSMRAELDIVTKNATVSPTYDLKKFYSLYFSGTNNLPVTYFTHVYYEKSTKLFVLLPGVGVKPGEKKLSSITLAQATSIYLKNKVHNGKFKTQALARQAALIMQKASNEWVKALSGPSASQNFGQFITEINVSYTMDGASQVQFTVVDEDYKFMESNFFQNRREILYRGQAFEIGATEVGQGQGSSPYVSVTAWESAVQKMKRDKKPENIAGSSVFEYAFNAARKYGLKFVGEKSNKTQSINKGSGNNADENVWSVLQSNASTNEFVLFVMDGTLFYASQPWLLYRIGTDQKKKGNTTQNYSRLYFDPKGTLPEDAKKFEVLQYPTIRQSENDPLEGDGRITVAKPNGCIIRPGMTVIVGPKPTLFRGAYLVTEVSFQEGSNQPVEISFRTPIKPKKEDDD